MNNDIKNIISSINLNPSFLRDIGNGIMLSSEEEKILTNYQIDYKNCCNTKELIFKIEDYLNDSYEELVDLENISSRLAEYNYYNDTNK